MGFFGPSKAEIEKQKIELSLGQSFQNGTLLRGIINCIKHVAEKEEDMKWILNATGYYDSRERVVVIDNRGILVMKCSLESVRYEEELAKRVERAFWFGNEEKINNRIADYEKQKAEIAKIENFYLDYTMFGYTPLPDFYENPERTVYLSAGDIREIWAKSVQTGISDQIQTISFGEPVSYEKYCAIPYSVPALRWMNWF